MTFLGIKIKDRKIKEKQEEIKEIEEPKKKRGRPRKSDSPTPKSLEVIHMEDLQNEKNEGKIYNTL